MTRTRPTDITDLLAEDLVRLLDYLSRVLGAADDGNLHYLHDKAHGLAGAARQVYDQLSTDQRPNHPEDFRRLDETQTFNPVRLRTLLTTQARFYRAGRALYPVGGDINAATAKHALDRAALDLEFGAPDAAGLTPDQVYAVAQWLREQAPKEARR
ncbi:hypothetical protein [Crossiella sp. CA198]|uniref:hypothetical protein n=1 Tax=Crossiella sp. CA198 TaxID=3455607 RepID=UPI003F8D6042